MKTLPADMNKGRNAEVSCIPTEIVYADDCDFISEDNSRSRALKEIVIECLGRFNLLVNEKEHNIRLS